MSEKDKPEPWPETEIEPGFGIEDVNWGYLSQTESGDFTFDGSKRPTDQEIIKRWGYKLKRK